MVKTKYSNGRLSLLPAEYGTFRPKIFKFLLEKVLPNSKNILDPMAGSAPLIPYIEKAGKKGYFNDIIPLFNLINKAKTYNCFLALRKKEKKIKTTAWSDTFWSACSQPAKLLV